MSTKYRPNDDLVSCRQNVEYMPSKRRRIPLGAKSVMLKQAHVPRKCRLEVDASLVGKPARLESRLTSTWVVMQPIRLRRPCRSARRRTLGESRPVGQQPPSVAHSPIRWDTEEKESELAFGSRLRGNCSRRRWLACSRAGGVARGAGRCPIQLVGGSPEAGLLAHHDQIGCVGGPPAQSPKESEHIFRGAAGYCGSLSAGRRRELWRSIT